MREEEGIGLDTLTQKYCEICDIYSQRTAEKVRSVIPSPHSELLLGTTLGINDLNKTPRFNDILVSTGTIHVVVVSGYNIALVFNHIINLLRGTSPKVRLLIAQIIAVIYSLLSGFEPPVLRSLLMVSIVFWVKFYGRNINVYFVLFLTALLMLVFNPFYLVSLSFQLSFMATLGLVVFASPIERFLVKYLGKNVIVSDFSASTAAQILVFPLISYYFGRVSVLSSIINSIVLWLIPLVTMIGMTIVLGISIHLVVGKVISVIFLPFSFLFVNILYFLDKMLVINLDTKISLSVFVIYYILVGVISYKLARK